MNTSNHLIANTVWDMNLLLFDINISLLIPMKKILLFNLILLFSLSTAISQSVILQREAPLMDENYTIDGTAYLEELDNGDLQLRLSEDYDTPTGPDVRMYLSNSLSITGAIEIADLSDLNHFSGAMTFDVPIGININDYQYVVFYCLSFNQLWASGEFGTAIVISDDLCESSSTSSNGLANIDICPSDGDSDIISLSNSSTLEVGTNYAYLITDDNEILEEVVLIDSYDFEGTSEETQRVYGISYDGNLNASIGQNRLSTTATECFIHSDANTYLTITKDACPPDYECLETNTSSNGISIIEICPTDGTNDWIDLDNNLFIPVGINYAYLITDQNEIVQDVVYSGMYNFEGSNLDEQRVYGVNFDENLNVQFGQNRMNTTALGCYTHSSSTNYLTVLKTACIPPYECEVSTTSTSNNNSEVAICPTDGISDIITLSNNLDIPAGDQYAYLITDSNEIVQEVSYSSSLEFEGSGLEEQRVYGINYDGELDVQIGSSRMATSASECFEHSSSNSFLTVLKTACPPVFECLENSTSSDQGNNLSVCYDENIEENITLSNSLGINAGDHYAYLITDQNQILLEVIFTDSHSFSNNPIGSTIQIFGIHYDGILDAKIGQNRMETTSSNCYTHSSDSDFVILTIIDCSQPPYECNSSSTSAVNDNLIISICANDENDDIIEFENSLEIETSDNYVYLITDTSEILEEVVFASSYNFEGSGESTQRIYGLNYDGELDIKIGEQRTETIASLCFEHSSSSSFLTITKDDCAPPPYECSESLTATTDWESSVNICPTDGIDDIVAFRNSAMIQDINHYAYLITDENQILQEVVIGNSYNFENSGEETQRVYGINYDGQLNAQIGSHRLETAATGCYIHSGENIFLTINKTACTIEFECLESVVASEAWVTEINICASDGEEDEVFIQNNIMTEPGENYAFLITDTNEILQQVIYSSIFDFENSGEETQRIYGISYDGDLNIALEETRKNTTATECYIHSSDNLFITIDKTSGCITSVNDDSLADEINVFPNPTSSFINIDIETDEIPRRLSVINFYGQLMSQYQVTDKNIILDTNSYASGSYILRFEYANQIINTTLQILK